MKKNLKNNRGITLVALIITIIVLLILAVVSITSISNSNIIKHAQDARNSYSIEDEKEKITLALHEALLENQGSITETGVKSGMTTYFGQTGWKETSSDANIMIVEIVNSKRKYKITLSTGKVELITDGTDTPEPEPTKTMKLNASTINLTLKTGEDVTAELTATLTGLTGVVNWSVKDSNIASISNTTGNTIVVTALASGTTEITATCESYSAKCTLTVEPANVWKERGLTKVQVDKLYSNSDGTKTYKFLMDGTLISTEQSIQTMNTSTVQNYIDNGTFTVTSNTFKIGTMYLLTFSDDGTTISWEDLDYSDRSTTLTIVEE